MKTKTVNRLYLLPFLFIGGMLMISSCKQQDPKSPEADSASFLNDDYYEFKGVSMKSYEIPAMIMLPDETANIGASTKPDIIHTVGGFTWDILIGPNFEIHIEDFGDFKDLVATQKKKIEDEGVFKIHYLVDEKDLIVYESTLIVKGSKKASPTVGIEHKSYHVYGEKVINNIHYELRSRVEGFEKPIIELMAKSIRSFKPLK